jgi:hypothetical protein
MCANPRTLTQSAPFKLDLSENEEPIRKVSSKEQVSVIVKSLCDCGIVAAFRDPKIESDDPILANARIDMVLELVAKSSMDKFEPKQLLPRMEIEDDIPAKFNTDNRYKDPNWNIPVVETCDPIWQSERTDIVLPRCA